MENFLEWLITEKQNEIVFRSFNKAGTVVVDIRGKRYEYDTDAVYHDRWKKLARYAPGRVLSQIKDMVNHGLAHQVNPAPVMQKLQQPSTSCPNCRTPEPHYVSGIECPGCGLNT